MLRYILLFVVLFLTFGLSAQSPLLKQWDYRFGGTGDDDITLIEQTNDKGYILGGTSSSGADGDKTQSSLNTDYWIVKIDSTGRIEWNRRYGGIHYETLTSMEQTTDGGFILGGYTVSDSTGDITQPHIGHSIDNDFWIIKVDSLGNIQWDKRFGTTDHDFLTALQQTFDRGYILGGYTSGGISGDKTQDAWDNSLDYWIIKIDSAGNKQWDKRFGGVDRDWLRSLKQTPDKGYILGGHSQSGISGDRTENTKGTDDYWIIKIDSIGNKEWDKRYGGNIGDFLYSLQVIRDGGYILAGNSNSYGSNIDYWVVRIDSLGNEKWKKNFGGNGGEDLVNICQTPEGGFLLSGSSSSEASGSKSEDNIGQRQGWLVKIDSNGIKQWDKTILTSGPDGTGFAIQTSDGCFAVGISSRSGIGWNKSQLNWDTSGFSNDYWIIKFCDSTCIGISATISSFTSHVSTYGASDGAAKVIVTGGTAPYRYLWNHGQTTDHPTDLSAGIYSVTVTDAHGCFATTSFTIEDGPLNVLNPSLNLYSIHPNPTNSMITIKLAAGINKRGSLELYNAMGKLIWQQPLQKVQFKEEDICVDLSTTTPGILFLHIQTDSGNKIEKIVKL